MTCRHKLDHVVEGLEGRIRPHAHAEHEPGKVNDIGEVLQRVVGRLLHEREAEDRDGNVRDGVAVGLGIGRHLRRAGRAAGAVVDDHGLAQDLASRVGHGPVPAPSAWRLRRLQQRPKVNCDNA
jgi:hypothetical protein